VIEVGNDGVQQPNQPHNLHLAHDAASVGGDDGAMVDISELDGPFDDMSLYTSRPDSSRDDSDEAEGWEVVMEDTSEEDAPGEDARSV